MNPCERVEWELYRADLITGHYWQRISKWWKDAGNYILEPKCEEFVILASQALEETDELFRPGN